MFILYYRNKNVYSYTLRFLIIKGAGIMKKTITPGQISQTNLKLIYQYIYQNDAVSQQDIAYSLQLSRPTVSVKINELEEKGLICKAGQVSSNLAGRKAAALSIVPDYRVAIGIEVMKNLYKILVVDLRGHYSLRTVTELPYENSDQYIETLCKGIMDYIHSLDYSKEQILGIGISLQGLVNAAGTCVTYGKILDCTGLTIDRFTKHLNYPCRFLHDASAAADSELWVSPELSNFVYMNISVHLGATIVHDRKILTGKHGYSGTVEHIQVIPNGKMCYCGRRGCIETICSMSALLGDDDEDLFFEKRDAKDEDALRRWNEYLGYLSRTIHNMHLLYNEDFVLGGYLASRLREEDIDLIYENIKKYSPFPETLDYVRISKMPKHNITFGAALPYIREFLSGELIF